MVTAALVFEGVSFAFAGASDKALDDVGLSLVPGQVTGLLGPDGAGKTTLMRLAAGLLRPQAGRIRVLDMDALADPLAVQSTIGYMPQRFGLYEDLTVQENLDLYADLQGVAEAERPARFGELMHMTGLAPFTGRLAGRLSGGMKQKLGLACALVRSPPLLLLDEPTVGVDPVSRRELWEIVYGQVQAQGMTVLLSTAYLDEAERCDQVILLHRGRLLGQGSPASFSTRLTGRTFELRVAGGEPPRRYQARVARQPGILDALVQREQLRILTREPGALDPARLLPGVPGVEIRPVPPRFEDAFVALLRGGEETAAPATATQVQVPGDRADEVIRVRGLQRRFGDFVAVDDVSFSVRRGAFFGLLGATGAGKPTPFRLL